MISEIILAVIIGLLLIERVLNRVHDQHLELRIKEADHEHARKALEITANGMRDLAMMLKAQTVKDAAAIIASREPAIFAGEVMDDERDARVLEEARAAGSSGPPAPGPMPRNWHRPTERPAPIPEPVSSPDDEDPIAQERW